mgnify:CR=1 FL=1
MFYSIIFIINFIIFRYFIKNYANKIGDEKLSDNKKIFYNNATICNCAFYFIRRDFS